MTMGRLKEFYIRGERYEEGAEGETRCNSHQNLYENIIRTIAAGYLCARKRISSFQKRTLYVHVSYHHALPPPTLSTQNADMCFKMKKADRACLAARLWTRDEQRFHIVTVASYLGPLLEVVA